jgi:hypothetical protein
MLTVLLVYLAVGLACYLAAEILSVVLESFAGWEADPKVILVWPAIIVAAIIDLTRR